MERKYYLRGLGLGIVVTAIIMGLALPKKAAMTDEEVIARAKKLGMSESTLLSDAWKEEDSEGAQAMDKALAGADAAGAQLSLVGNDADAQGSDAKDAAAGGTAGNTSGKDVAGNAGEADAAGAAGNASGKGNAGDASDKDVAGNAGEADAAGAAGDASGKDGAENAGEADAAGNASGKGGAGNAGEADAADAAGNASGKGGAEDAEETDAAGAAEDASQKGGAQDAKDTDKSGTTGNKTSGKGNNAITSAQVKTITIVSGDGSFNVAKKLAEAGVILSADNFDTFLCENGYDKKLQTGTFSIPADASDEQIARIVTRTE